VSDAAMQRHKAHLTGCIITSDADPDASRCTEDARAEAVTSPTSPFNVQNPGDDPSTAPRKLIAATLEDEAFDLRIKGKTYTHISRVLNVSRETAMDLVERVLIRTIGKTDKRADHLREVEVRRCDELVEAIWDSATTGSDPDVKGRAMDRVLRASERKAKLLGLDAATGANQIPFYLATGFDEFLGVLLAPLQERHPDALTEALEAARGHIAMLAAQRPQKPGLRLISGGRT
jgi:hypothetical protein